MSLAPIGRPVEDDLAFQSPEERHARQTQRLRSLVRSAVSDIPYYQSVLAGVEVNELTDLEALPILRKEDLVELQQQTPPFGGHLPGGSNGADYLFASPGPIHEPGFMREGYWSIERPLRVAGFGADDIVFNTFSYHLTPGAWILDSGAKAIGCAVIPAGTAPFDLQLQALEHYQPTAFCGIPDFLKRLVEGHEADGKKPLSLRKALVSGGALTPSLRSFFDEKGIAVLQTYATAELGAIAYETPARDGLLVNENVIVEIVDPDTGKHQPFGEVGEVVVTTLRDDYPLIRFGTGDLSMFVEGNSPCGRTAPRIAGWMGRADLTTKVRGMFVRPTQISDLIAQLPSLERARLVVDRANDRDEAMLHCEWSGDEELLVAERVIADKFRALCHVSTKVTLVPNGSIPDDGKVIVDLR